MAVTPIAKTTRHANVAKSVEQVNAPKTARQARAEKADDRAPSRERAAPRGRRWQAAHALVQKDPSILGSGARPGASDRGRSRTPSTGIAAPVVRSPWQYRGGRDRRAQGDGGEGRSDHCAAGANDAATERSVVVTAAAEGLRPDRSSARDSPRDRGHRGPRGRASLGAAGPGCGSPASLGYRSWLVQPAARAQVGCVAAASSPDGRHRLCDRDGGNTSSTTGRRRPARSSQRRAKSYADGPRRLPGDDHVLLDRRRDDLPGPERWHRRLRGRVHQDRDVPCSLRRNRAWLGLRGRVRALKRAAARGVTAPLGVEENRMPWGGLLR